MMPPDYQGLVVIKAIRPGARVTRGTAESAAMDLHFIPSPDQDKPVTILPGRSAVLETGIALDIGQSSEMPELGIAGQIWPRSGLSVNERIETGAGLIDPDYRGEVKVHLYNHGTLAQTIMPGDRIAQIMFVTFYRPRFNSVVEDTADGKGRWLETEVVRAERGSGGFGSTGQGVA